MEYVSKDLLRNVSELRAMLAEAVARQVPIDSSNTKAFHENYDVPMLQLNSELAQLKADLLNQGVLMTHEELV